MAASGRRGAPVRRSESAGGPGGPGLVACGGALPPKRTGPWQPEERVVEVVAQRPDQRGLVGPAGGDQRRRGQAGKEDPNFQQPADSAGQTSGLHPRRECFSSLVMVFNFKPTTPREHGSASGREGERRREGGREGGMEGWREGERNECNGEMEADDHGSSESVPRGRRGETDEAVRIPTSIRWQDIYSYLDNGPHRHQTQAQPLVVQVLPPNTDHEIRTCVHFGLLAPVRVF